jgi:uridine monophosphate synthetase
VFVLCRTSNPAAAAIQGNPADEASPALQVVRTVQRWGTPEQVALEVGTADPGVLARFRAAAPERLILLRSLWSGRDNLDALLDAGRDAQGGGLLVPVPQEVFQSHDPGQAVAELRARLSRPMAEKPAACPIWRPDLCLLRHDPHEELILQLFDTGCILFGEYVQASGAVFPYYVDLRRVISNPQLFQAMIDAYTALIKDLSFDRIAGIPYGALPTATGLALRLNRAMIYPRKEVKAHGTRQVVEGAFRPGEKVVVVDDILISGKSALEGVRKLQSVGLMVEDIVVLIDHGGSPVAAKLAAEGLRTHAVLPFERIVETLHAAGRIDDHQLQILEATG